jgi:hypothetical protein
MTSNPANFMVVPFSSPSGFEFVLREPRIGETPGPRSHVDGPHSLMNFLAMSSNAFTNSNASRSRFCRGVGAAFPDEERDSMPCAQETYDFLLAGAR